MTIICPSCRLINSDDAVLCAGCGGPLAGAARRRDGSGITMFGSAPRTSSVKPLDEAHGRKSASASYGESESTGYVSLAESAKQSTPAKGVAFSAGCSKPKKPWE